MPPLHIFCSCSFQCTMKINSIYRANIGLPKNVVTTWENKSTYQKIPAFINKSTILFLKLWSLHFHLRHCEFYKSNTKKLKAKLHELTITVWNISQYILNPCSDHVAQHFSHSVQNRLRSNFIAYVVICLPNP